MADSETSTLIGAQQTAVNVGAPAQSPRPSRAYKVAGLTLLASVLIVGQGLTAYFLLSQRSDIKSLEEQNKEMTMEYTKGRSGGGASVPARMHIPMNALPEMTDFTSLEESSTATQGKKSATLTPCQQEAAGLKAVQVPDFQPTCDKQGLYKAQQCFMGQCWCVNTANGEQIPGSLREGPAGCSKSAISGALLTLTADDA
ncbi:CD74 molecule, major histocompatibility complex, class II invariant chain b [Odontesthes bonariensis]|uniref:CD74 molecule, major histocompatibility complex, class II invariant chain b n=1 Tax=Odontesthes bonariensis TaxID=219752 RepID=UPI003F58C2CC